MLILVFVAFVAGILTVLTPCSLPLLPIVIGGSANDSKNKLKPYIIVGSLVISIILFTLLIRVSTLFIELPDFFWAYFSGIILILISLTILFPITWARISAKFGVEQLSNRWLANATRKSGFIGDILTGFALGPVFSSCSPTYFIILAAILPQGFLSGLFLLIIYTLGIAIVLLPIALVGQRFVNKLGSAADPKGWFKKGIGILILLIGVLIFTGLLKDLETYLIDSGFNFVQLEESLLENVDLDTTTELDL